MPATVEVSGKRRMLMVLPSSLTCQREDAIEAERMLASILDCPADAADRYKLLRPCCKSLGHPTGNAAHVLVFYGVVWQGY